MTVSSLKQPITRLVGHSQRHNTHSGHKTRRRKARVDGLPCNSAVSATTHDLVKNTPLFAELTSEQQYVISSWMKSRNFRSDDILFGQGSPSDTLYLVQNGWVKLFADNRSVVPTIFGPGSLLGETDFFLGRPHTYTARASSDVTVWLLDNLALPKILTEQPEIGLGLGLAFGTGIAQFRKCLADALGIVPLLQNLSSDERNVIARYLSPHHYSPRETIYRSGDPPTGIFFIEWGQVWLLGETDDFTELSAGQTFGEQAVILNRRHAYTAQAATDLIVWQLSPIDFATLTATHPTIIDTVHQNLQTSLTEALVMASLVVSSEMQALSVAYDQQNGLAG